MLSDEEISSLSSELDIDDGRLLDELEKLASYNVDAKAAEPTLRVKYSPNGRTIFDIRGISTVRGHFLLTDNYDSIEKISTESAADLGEVKYLSEQLAEELIDNASQLLSSSVKKEIEESPMESGDETIEMTSVQAAIDQQVDAEASSAPFTAGESLVKATPPIERKGRYPGTCGFVFDPGAWPGHSNQHHRHDVDRFEDDIWRCPHDAPEDETYCIFHQSPEEKNNDEVIRQLIEKVTQRSNQRLDKQFIGARFSELDLSREIIDPADTYTINLKHISVLGETNFEGTRFGNAIDISHSRLDGGLVLDESTFEDKLRIYHCYIDSTVEGRKIHCAEKMQFSQSQCSYGVRFDGANFERGASFSNTHFESYLECNGTTFSGPANFIGTQFKYKLEFKNVSFEDKSRFCGAVFDLDEERDYVPEFRGARFEEEAIFGDHDRFDDEPATFNQCPNFSDTRFLELVTYKGTAFRKGADISGATFHRDVDFGGAKIGSTLSGSGCQIEGSIDLNLASTYNSTILLDFCEASISSGKMSQPLDGNCYYDCTDAVLGDIIVSHDNHESFPLDYVRLVRTEFDGFDFMRYRVGLERNNWQIHTFKGNPPVEPSTIDALDRELTYLRAKSGANQIGDSRAASGFFQREMRSRRDRFGSLAQSRDSLSETIKARYKQGINWGFDKVCHYGEGPVQTAKSMIVVIFLFAVLYAGLFSSIVDGTPYPEMEYTASIEYFLFSAESFITIVHNPSAHIDSLIIRTASVIQGFLGGLFIALFLFTLTRYVHR